jgi:RNA-binding protein 18
LSFPLYWFTLLKLLQTYGAIEKFDLLFHRAGPLIGQPRGYAFVTYSSLVNTQRALKALHGKLVGTTRISVRLAHSVPKVRILIFYKGFERKISSLSFQSELEKQKPEINIPALAVGANKEGRGR